MNFDEIIDAKRKNCANKIVDWKKRNLIFEDTYQKFRKFNNTLARDIVVALMTGKDMLENKEIKSIDELIHLIKVDSPNETLMQMLSIISGNLGRKNHHIRKTAHNFRKMVCEINGDNSIDIIGSHYCLAGKATADLNDLEKKQLKLTALIAESIFEQVLHNFDYINERGEYLQPPVFTLRVVKGGDCDDLSMLLCSLWESIGFETTLNFIPGHVYPGVKLVIATSKGKAEIFNVPADPTEKRFSIFTLSYALCAGNMDYRKELHEFYNAECFTVPPIEYPVFNEVKDFGRDYL